MQSQAPSWSLLIINVTALKALLSLGLMASCRKSAEIEHETKFAKLQIFVIMSPFLPKWRNW